MISVAFLWAMIITSFPAYCWMDIRRQNAGRYDCLFCMKKPVALADEGNGDDSGQASPTRNTPGISSFVYDYVYKPLLITSGVQRSFFGVFVFWSSLALLGVSIWGLASKTSVGLGLEDFFPKDHQASLWAQTSADHLASWSITMNWGTDSSSPFYLHNFVLPNVLAMYSKLDQAPSTTHHPTCNFG